MKNFIEVFSMKILNSREVFCMKNLNDFLYDDFLDDS